MATIYWEIPPEDYFEVWALIAEAAEASVSGPKIKAEELEERIRRYPGYPHSRTKDDTVVVIPKNARIYITPEPKETAP